MDIIGINIGGTTATIVLGDDSGHIAHRRSFPTGAARGSEALYAFILNEVRDLQGSAVQRIGVAVGGPVNARTGVVIEPPHLPFRDFPLGAKLRDDCGLPVVIHHDAAACALAEWRWGADAGVSGLAYLTCGTGFGAGLVLDGRPRYGSNGFSPEIGHVRYRDDGPNIFGKPGCFEGYGSANAIALLGRDRQPIRFASATPEQITALAREGDAEAAAIVHDNAAAVGAACALLADLLVLDVIALGTLSHRLGDAWIAEVRAVFEGEVLEPNRAGCRIRACMDGVQDLASLAAALAPL